MANKNWQLKFNSKPLTIKRFSFIFLMAIAIWLIIISVESLWSKYQYKKFIQRRNTAVINPVKVFQIGFSKCGTVSLYSFFANNGIPSIHHDYDGLLASSIHENYLNNLPLISKMYSKILVFTDMEVLYKTPQIMVGMQYFKELDKQYPGSKFILNTRNKEAWLKSRSLQDIKPSGGSLLKINADILKITKDEVLERWGREWDEHHRAVMEYFKGRPNDLLVFNIENDSPEKLVVFFKDNFNLDSKYYEKKNQTLFRGLREWYSEIWGDKKFLVLLNERVLLDPEKRSDPPRLQ